MTEFMTLVDTECGPWRVTHEQDGVLFGGPVTEPSNPTHEQIIADRERLVRDWDDALAALDRSPLMKAAERALFNLRKHELLYGTGDLSVEPVGLLNNEDITR